MRCSWALGAQARQQMHGLRTLTQQPQRHSQLWKSSPLWKSRPCRHLHTTLAVTQQQPHQQQAALEQAAAAATNTRQQLGWQDLHRAAQIAAWSGLCYLMPDELQATISSKHKGLTLVASGRNGYTAWFVADGVVPAAQFCTTISSRSSSNTNGNGNSSSNGNGASSRAPNNPASPSSAGGGYSGVQSSGGVCARVPPGTRERFVFLRGVQWAAPDINSTQLSQALMSLWPTQFPKGSGSGSGSSSGGGSWLPGGGSGSTGSGAAGGGDGGSPLVAHAGVADIAQGLFSQLRPYMQQADDAGMQLTLAGHSLGGSLAMLLLVLHQMNRRDRQKRPWPGCYTFGSPPVLAHSTGGGTGPVLQALGLPPDAINCFVLEADPVPRALLSVDPTFQLFSGWSAVKGLLQLRELFVGSGSPLSPGRFLFESVGQVHLIKWSPEGGACVVPLDAAEIEQELSLLAPLTTAAKQPASSSNGGGGDGSQPRSAAASASAGGGGAAGAGTAAPTPDAQLQQQVQDMSGLSSAPAAAAGGAAAALMSSLRAWLDHHHRSYAQELEAAALRSVRQQLAAEQQQQQGQQKGCQGQQQQQQGQPPQQ